METIITKEINPKEKNRGFRELTRNAIRAMEGEGNERKFIISFSSELAYGRWYGIEILDHSEGCVDLTRINEIGCVLFNHNRNAVIGKINRAWLENRKGYAEIEFDTDEESEKIYQKVKSGTLKGVSVGYNVSLWEEVKANSTSTDGRFKGPVSIAKKWTPFETSIVSIPADFTVGVGREETGNFEPSLTDYGRQLIVNKNIILGGEVKCTRNS